MPTLGAPDGQSISTGADIMRVMREPAARTIAFVSQGKANGCDKGGDKVDEAFPITA